MKDFKQLYKKPVSYAKQKISDFLGFAGSSLTLKKGEIKSPNFVRGKSGWILRSDGTIEAQVIIAGSYITLFSQGQTTDGIPTSEHIKDMWFDNDNDNKMYVAAKIGATIIGSGEWELTTEQGAIVGTNLKDSSLNILEDAEVKNIDSFTAGEDINKWDALRIYTDGKVYKASSIHSDFTSVFLGFALETITKGNAIKAQLIGYVPKTGLSKGNLYYLADGSYDQQQTVGANGTGATYPRAQSFTTGSGVTKIDWIEVKGERAGSSGTPTVKFEIYAADANGFPTGSVLGTTETRSIPLSWSFADWRIFTFPAPVELNENTKYAIKIIDVTKPVGGNYFKWHHSNNDEYAGGVYSRFDGGWVDMGSDLGFKTAYADGSISTSQGTVTKKACLAITDSKSFILNS